MSNKKKIDAMSEASLEVAKAKYDKMKAEELEQQRRDQLLAQAHMYIGRIQASTVISKFADVVSFVWLKEVKESKVYKEVPGIKTWESFCNHCGISRAKVDMDILNLNAFGEEFLTTLADFKVGYRDLRKLRGSITEGDLRIEDKAIEINGERIPFDPDHKEDLQAAIEMIIDRKDEEIEKREKDAQKKEKITEEEIKGLKVEREALIKENKRLKVFDIEDKEPEWNLEQIKVLVDSAHAFNLLCRKFIIDDRLEDDLHIQAQVQVAMTEASNSMRDLERLWNERFNSYYDDIP
jgi:hypothetical protein